MGVNRARPEHEVAFQDICAMIAKHAEELSAVEVLAIASNLVGKLIAMQDQRRMTPEDAMKIVQDNIEEGNRQALEYLRSNTAGLA